MSRQRNSETRWKRTIVTSFGVSFGNYRRRCRDVVMGRREYVPLKHLSGVPLRCCWVFHLRFMWDVVETYWWNVVIMSTWNFVTTFQYDAVETYHWHVLVTYHLDVVGCFTWDVPATSLGRTERRHYDVGMMSCCRVGSIYHTWKNIKKS